MTTVLDRTKGDAAGQTVSKKGQPAAPPGTTLSKANKGAKVDPTQPLPGEEILEIPIADIFPDFAWNMRSEANVLADSESDAAGGVKELATSMATRGQEQPVVLRPNVHKKGPKLNHNRDETSYLPWELVAGFRRWVAGKSLNDDPKEVEQSQKSGRNIIPNVKNGCLRAVIRKYDDLQAKLCNGAENAHDPIEPPDLMAHIVTLNKPPYQMSVGEIAENQGYALSTVHRYANVGFALIPEILTHWRFGGAFDDVAAGKRVSLEEIEEVSKKKKEDQPAAYKELLLGKKANEKKKDWFVAAEKRAVSQGEFLARLVKEKVVTITDRPWVECLDAIIKVPKGAKTRVREALARKLEAAYDRELAKDDTEKEEDSE